MIMVNVVMILLVQVVVDENDVGSQRKQLLPLGHLLSPLLQLLFKFIKPQLIFLRLRSRYGDEARLFERGHELLADDVAER